MCGRAYSTYTDEELAARYLNRRPLNLDLKPNFNLGPKQKAPVVVVKNGERTIELLEWGYTKPIFNKSYFLINVNATTITTKKSHDDEIRFHRCVVPVSGFYEWHNEGVGADGQPKRKRPFALYLKDRSIMSLAGVCRETPDGFHFAVVTSDHPNALVARVHEKTPVILTEPEQLEFWLNPEITEKEEVLKLLRMVPAELMAGHEVSPAVGNVRNNRPDLLGPVGEVLEL